jgi:hypothetical protein
MSTQFHLDYDALINALAFGKMSEGDFFQAMEGLTIKFLEDRGHLTEEHQAGGELAEEGAEIIETTLVRLTNTGIEVALDRARAAVAAQAA